ncbi:MAG: dehalogenase [Candidatus Entotheonella factor]|uniref:Dehalogenase n=1 Tax=Entotheonella factor TaxID=1429438 RepID=W4LCI2_ENTF1|nr:MAG: dehalogenase [Candidatus Entotheonella factor]
MARDIYKDRLDPSRMDAFLRDFGFYRYDEVLGAWKPYDEVIQNALRRTCERWGLGYRDMEGQQLYEAIATWGPHADVPEPLVQVGQSFPLVILSNASDDQIQSNVARLGASIHAVYTSQQAHAYKPRLQAFEYMIDNLGCTPSDLLHVSSSVRYDLMSAHFLGIQNKVFVNRGYDPPIPAYEYHEIANLGGLPKLLGL